MQLSLHNWPTAKGRLWKLAEDGNTVFYFQYKDLIIGKDDSMLKLVSTVFKFLVKAKFLWEFLELELKLFLSEIR